MGPPLATLGDRQLRSASPRPRAAPPRTAGPAGGRAGRRRPAGRAAHPGAPPRAWRRPRRSRCARSRHSRRPPDRRGSRTRPPQLPPLLAGDPLPLESSPSPTAVAAPQGRRSLGDNGTGGSPRRGGQRPRWLNGAARRCTRCWRSPAGTTRTVLTRCARSGRGVCMLDPADPADRGGDRRRQVALARVWHPLISTTPLGHGRLPVRQAVAGERPADVVPDLLVGRARARTTSLRLTTPTRWPSRTTGRLFHDCGRRCGRARRRRSPRGPCAGAGSSPRPRCAAASAAVAGRPQVRPGVRLQLGRRTSASLITPTRCPPSAPPPAGW